MKRGRGKYKLKSLCLERCGIGTEEKILRVIEEGEDWRRFKEFETESATLKEELTAVELELSILFVPINKERK
ncbi:MAG: hypothetical protein ACNYVW_03390, partial [Methanosarcinales archaeon]